MTLPDPLDGILFPFGVVFFGDGLSSVLVPHYTPLRAGVHTVQVTWSQPSRLRITLSPQMANADRVEIADVPAGSGRRTAIIAGIGVPEGESRYLSLLANEAQDPSVEATIQVTSMPLQE